MSGVPVTRRGPRSRRRPPPRWSRRRSLLLGGGQAQRRSPRRRSRATRPRGPRTRATQARSRGCRAVVGPTAEAAGRMTSSSTGRAASRRPGGLQAVERDQAAEEQDHGELQHLLDRRGARVHGVVLVVPLAAAGDPPAKAARPVGAGHLGDAVDGEHGAERGPAVELAVDQARSRRRAATADRPQPPAAPIATPARVAYATSAANHSAISPASQPPATIRPRSTNGKARPSFRPASRRVSAKAGSTSSRSPSGPTPNSPSTGSVGAGHGAEHDRRAGRRAMPTAPRPPPPRSSAASMPSSRTVNARRARSASGRRRPAAKARRRRRSRWRARPSHGPRSGRPRGVEQRDARRAHRADGEVARCSPEYARARWWLRARIATSTAEADEQTDGVGRRGPRARGRSPRELTGRTVPCIRP